MILNQKAWELLLPDEKMALSLQLGMDKSSWESGEIMNRSHYKYLEIKYRAEYFLKMFTEHLELFDVLFPEYITGNPIVLDYFRYCIENRYKPIKAITLINEKHGKIHKKTLNDLIIKVLKKWDKEDNAYDKTTLDLVKNFDRWNNFRILPKEIQEPSAFKRRVKNSYKKQLRVLMGIHPLALQKLLKLYQTKNNPSIYLPLLMPEPVIFKMKANRNSTDIFNTLGLYVFKDKKLAEEYIHLVHEYVLKGKDKDCIDGLNFWPKFREIIKMADNYHAVMKISSSRKYLQIAMEKFQLL